MPSVSLSFDEPLEGSFYLIDETYHNVTFVSGY